MVKQGLDKRRYDSIASVYDSLESPMELLAYARWREKVLQWIPAEAHILEVGVGTGKILPYYLKTHEVFAIDISARMLERVKGVAAEQSPVIHLAQMEVESLAFRARFLMR